MSEETDGIPLGEVSGPPVLVAGFAGFPSAPKNPSQDVARRIEVLAQGTGAVAKGIVLPVEWNGAWAPLEAAIRAGRPRAVLLVGLHARSERFRIERLAFNERETGRVDAAGRGAPASRIMEGPGRLESRLPMAAIGARLQAAGIDFEFSDDAGRYLCNDTLYRLALDAERLGVERYGFLHTPLTRELAGEGGPPPGGRLVGRAELDRAVREVLASIAADLRAINGS